MIEGVLNDRDIEFWPMYYALFFLGTSNKILNSAIIFLCNLKHFHHLRCMNAAFFGWLFSVGNKKLNLGCKQSCRMYFIALVFLLSIVEN